MLLVSNGCNVNETKCWVCMCVCFWLTKAHLQLSTTTQIQKHTHACTHTRNTIIEQQQKKFFSTHRSTELSSYEMNEITPFDMWYIQYINIVWWLWWYACIHTCMQLCNWYVMFIVFIRLTNTHWHAWNAHDYDIASMQWITHDNNSSSSEMNAKSNERVN